jgi:hypothetical protein
MANIGGLQQASKAITEKGRFTGLIQFKREEKN